LLLQKEINTGSLERKKREERNTGRKKEKQKGGKKHWSREKGERNKKQAQMALLISPSSRPVLRPPARQAKRGRGRPDVSAPTVSRPKPFEL
jgi:hypothetical protein